MGKSALNQVVGLGILSCPLDWDRFGVLGVRLLA